MMEVVVTTGAILKDLQNSSQIVTTNKPTPSFLQAECPSRRPTNSVRALKEKYTYIYILIYIVIYSNAKILILENIYFPR